MKDRMIIIREKVVFIVTVTHDEHLQKHEEVKSDQNEESRNLPDLEISAN